MLENGSRPQAVVMVPGVFELDVNHNADGARLRPINANIPNPRKVA
jgi:hypothetical protein